jgi:phosphoserine phosphatase RsbU/P
MMPPSGALSPEVKYRLLLKLSQEIGRSLDLEDVLRYLLESVRATVSYDAGGVFVLNRRVPLGLETGERVIAGMATVGFDDTPRDEDPMLRHGKGIIGHVIWSGQAVVAPDVAVDSHYVAGRAATRSEIAVPIVSEGEVIGALNLESDTVDAFTDNDVEFLEFFAVAAAIFIEKAILHREIVEKHRIDQQLRIAREVQAALLPATDPVVTGWDIAGTNVPSWEIGGDYYDYLRQPDGSLGLAIADVSGKGVPAALIMATFRAALRAQQPRSASIEQIAARLNRILLDSMDASRFVTAVFGLLDTHEGVFSYVNCGHIPPLVLRASRPADVLPSGGPALGMWAGAPFECQRVTIAAGDSLVLYTDGVVEVMNAVEEQFGVERLEDVLRANRDEPARGMVQAVVDATRSFAGRQIYEDDFTIVVLKRAAEAVGHVD